MSLHKAIASGKEKRKAFKGGKAVSCQCRNHGGCDYCLSSRLHRYNKRLLSAKQQMSDTSFAKDVEDGVD